MSNRLHKAKKTDKTLKGASPAQAAKSPAPSDKLTQMVEYFAKSISRRCSSRTLQGGELDRMFILSVSDGKTRAKTMSLSVQDQNESGWIQEIVPEIAKKLKTAQDKFAEPLCWLRLEWVIKQEKTNWADLSRTLRKYKRNYFRSGIALPGTKEPWLLLTEMELNANACLYPDNDEPTAQVNRNNLEIYIKARHGSSQIPQFSADLPVIIFQTDGVFLDAQTGQMHALCTDSRQQGHRKMPGLSIDSLQEILDLSSQYLASQIQENGQYRYGYFPCFGREIPTYNTLRHASSTYALLESYEACRTSFKTGETPNSSTTPVISNQRVTLNTLTDIQQRIGKALHYLITYWIRHYKDELSYLTDVEDDIKLGGNAVTILALVKYISVFPDDDNNAAYLNLANRLANGIIATQQHNGSFVHVLNANDLSVKKRHRIIYYDGEATFSLMRLYGITHEQKLLDCVVHAFEYFIANHHERAHDHWLAYCSNELVKYLPEKKYFDFAVRNVRGHVTFIRERITTFPTLLELSMAFHNTLMQLDAFPDFRDVLDGFNVSDFYHALHTRANYLLNGFFFPEMAMFYKYPQAILHGMFIRHHAFRVRIDDVEHYLSGFVAYQKLMLTKQYPKSLTELPSPNKADTGSETTFNGPVVFFGGDVNLGRRMHWKAQGVHPLADLDLMRKADLRIVNLECVIATRGEQGIDKGEGGPYYFRARPEQTNILMDAGVDMVATANNHSGDYGPKALLEQLEYLEKAGIAHAGSGATEKDAAKPAYLKAGELTVAVFSVDATTVRYAPSARTGIWYLPPDKPHLWEDAFKERLEDARNKAHIVFVVVHWGLNGLQEPRSPERTLGRLLIDLGADAVLGCHSHNVQGVEKYRERPILYDAGDFLFDAMSEVKAGGCFLLELSTDGVTRVMFQPLEVGYGRTVPASQPLEISQGFITRCKALETEPRLLSSGKAVVDFSPPKRSFSPEIPASPPALRNPIPPLDKPLPQWIVDEVPTDARMDPILLGPLMLVGCRIPPECLYMTHRRMLYVETYWQIPEATSMNCSFFMTGVPRRECRMPNFGASMGHEGCDWMWPTNRWKPGIIYRERFGLRPPELRQIVNVDLRLEIRVKVGDTVHGPYVYPRDIQLRFPNIPYYRNDFPACLHEHRPEQNWTASQLEIMTGGRWAVRPPEGWYVNSIVRGVSHIDLVPPPTLFVASSWKQLAFHEQFTTAEPKTWNTHNYLLHLSAKITGAIVDHHVPGLPPNFPQLIVKDPIQSLIELGIAARKRFQGKVIAVTGSVGKTTFVSMLRHILEKDHSIATTYENYNSRVGAPVVFASISPDVEYACLELAVSSLCGQRGPITLDVQPHVAVVTAVAEAHLDSFKTLEHVAKMKSKVFIGVVPGGYAVLNRDMPFYELFEQKANERELNIISFGKHSQATIRIEKDDGETFVHIDGRSYLLKCSVPPEQFGSALASLGVIRALKLPIEHAVKYLESFTTEKGRGDIHKITYKGKLLRLVDSSFNATPLSMTAGLAYLKSLEKFPQSRVAILGDIAHLGDRSAEIHRGLANALLAAEVDRALLCGPFMHFLWEDIKEKCQCAWFPSAVDLLPKLDSWLKDQDCIFVKGSIPAKLDIVIKKLVGQSQ